MDVDEFFGEVGHTQSPRNSCLGYWIWITAAYMNFIILKYALYCDTKRC